MSIKTETLTYFHDTIPLKGFLAYPASSPMPRPLVLVAHAWFGQNSFAREKAIALAGLGYVGFAIDMYGEGKVVTTPEEAKELMTPLINDKQVLRDRLMKTLEFTKTLPQVDSKRIAAIGYCFGGTCVLELAKSGTLLQGVVSFHGVLGNPHQLPMKEIATASFIPTPILVFHGYLDPMVSVGDLITFQNEMTQKKADWQLITYGQAGHAFTNPQAQDKGNGFFYEENADRRSWETMLLFFQEIFSNPSDDQSFL